MTTLTFLGSHITYQPTYIDTAVQQTPSLKYRGQSLEIREPLAAMTGTKGLKYRGVIY